MTIRREDIILLSIAVLAVLIRVYRLGGTEVFEDGYANYLITRNLYETGEYSDTISGMTGGNWLPFYHFLGAGLMRLTGSGSVIILWTLSIMLSGGTVLIAGLIGRRIGEGIGIAAALFWAINPLDILMSSMTLPDNLSLFALASASYLIMFRREEKGLLALGSIAMLIAVMTRYEAWIAIPLLGAWVVLSDRSRTSRWTLAAFLPAAISMVVWSIVSNDGTFVAGQVISQTSLQPKINSERTGLGYADLSALFIFHYVQFFLVIVLLASTFFFKRDKGRKGSSFFLASWLVFWVLVLVMIGSGLMVGSYRYLTFAAFAMTIVAAFQLRYLTGLLVERMNRSRSKRIDPGGHLTFSMAVVLVAILLFPSIDHTFSLVDSLSVLNEPQRRAGEWLKENYEGGVVIIDSPIVAYYSDIPIDMITGSRSLPKDRSEAFSRIKGNVSYVVFSDHPHFRIVGLFPELSNGTSWSIFKMVHSEESWEVDFGALPTYIYRIDPKNLTYRVGGGLSLRHYEERNMTIPLVDDVEVDGGGRGIGYPLLIDGGDVFIPSEPEFTYDNGTFRSVYRLDRTIQGASVDPVGTVVVRCRIANSTIEVSVDHRWTPIGTEIIILNELALMRYVDFAGNDTYDIEGWTEISATYNYLLDRNGNGIMMERVPGSRMFLGSFPGSGSEGVIGLAHVIVVSDKGPNSFEYTIHPV